MPKSSVGGVHGGEKAEQVNLECYMSVICVSGTDYKENITQHRVQACIHHYWQNCTIVIIVCVHVRACMHVCVCVWCVCVSACVHACVHACVRACVRVCGSWHTKHLDVQLHEGGPVNFMFWIMQAIMEYKYLLSPQTLHMTTLSKYKTCYNNTIPRKLYTYVHALNHNYYTIAIHLSVSGCQVPLKVSM